jgi:hypothetical protein
MSEEKKIVGRTVANVAIALGIICIILVVALVGAVMNYTSMVNGKDGIIASLDSQILDKDDTLSSLNFQVANLTGIINLSKSKVWVNHYTISHQAGYYTYWTFLAEYAGYVSVRIHSSNSTSTYVRAIYSAYGVKYDSQNDVVAGGEAVFPVLPSSGIEIRVGETDLFVGATENVTITYHY